MTPHWKIISDIKASQHLCNGKIVAECCLWLGSSKIFYLEGSLLTFWSVACPTSLDVWKDHGKEATSEEGSIQGRRHCAMFGEWCHSFLSCNLSGKACSWWQDGLSMIMRGRTVVSHCGVIYWFRRSWERSFNLFHTTYLYITYHLDYVTSMRKPSDFLEITATGIFWDWFTNGYFCTRKLQRLDITALIDTLRNWEMSWQHIRHSVWNWF